MEEAKSELQVHPSHVVVPLAFFEKVMQVYYSVRNTEVVPPKVPLESPASQRVDESLNLSSMTVVRQRVPEGHVPKGVAAKDEDA